MESGKNICSGCNREFQTAESLEQHRQAKHTIQPQQQQKKSGVDKKIVAAAVIAAILLVGGYFIFAGRGSANAGNPASDSNDGFDERAFAARIPKGAIHWHPHVTILVKGQSITVPPNVGLETAAHMPVHTHEADNILHWEVNAPTVKNMQLGYFFNTVWKKKFSSECILDYCSGPDGAVKMFVNGSPSSEFDHYMPRDGDEIKIVFE